MQAVKFKQSKSPYNAGEIAGFPDDIARILVMNGIAEAIDAEGAKDKDFKGMSWFELRAVVKRMTGEAPKNKREAMSILQRAGKI